MFIVVARENYAQTNEKKRRKSLTLDATSGALRSFGDVEINLTAEHFFSMWHRLCRGCFVNDDILGWAVTAQ